MSCFKNLIDFMGTYSGQIQIGIAIFALFLAWMAYEKILKQIELSIVQTNLTISQNEQELRINALELINKNVENNCKMLQQIPPLLKELNYIRGQMTDINKLEIINRNIKKLTNQKDTIEDTKGKLLQISKDFTSSKNLKSDQLNQHLNTLYDTLISSTNSINEYSLLVLNIEDIKIEENIS